MPTWGRNGSYYVFDLWHHFKCPLWFKRQMHKIHDKSMLFSTQCIKMRTDQANEHSLLPWSVDPTYQMSGTECAEDPLSLETAHVSTYLSPNPLDLLSLSLTPADGKERYLPRKRIPRKAKVSFSLRSRTESWSNWSFPDIFRELSVLKQEQPQRDFRKNGMPEKPFAYCRLCSNKCSCLRLILSNPPPSEKPFTHGTAKPEMGNVRGLHSWFTCCYWTN